MPVLLHLVPYDHPILRQQTAAVEFPLSRSDRDIIDNMLFSIQTEQLKAAGANYETAAGMAANQWGINKSIFLFCPEGNNIGPVEVIINPSYTILDQTPNEKNWDENWEGCFSVPNATGKVKRYLKIRVKYQDQTGQWIEKELSDWPARVWQHENDHLNGYLFDDLAAGKCVEKVTFNNKQEEDAFFERLRAERQQ